ncbi:hypothetical protein GUITHDRAFT_137895 [Guillardia theta CCMP2712]|uniref:Uncharacterized protein n=1 Tax=Guillardia theta (strain CCMP2712) TaxID=905079 RepID=L1JFN5_GUITC|nr:hypothetical protein GUITHDRAFT_137895 [Guillardia theta CCMP2712]EKX46910.1 hypothetical protein GUITHDRAFT_137895 [Guillardia theta CCMP2712]|eukprot:XP_005833890.1 hypothetical protein GUITHDRAFT_137895 [Guillardia theta CCMP2712]
MSYRTPLTTPTTRQVKQTGSARDHSSDPKSEGPSIETTGTSGTARNARDVLKGKSSSSRLLEIYQSPKRIMHLLDPHSGESWMLKFHKSLHASTCNRAMKLIQSLCHLIAKATDLVCWIDQKYINGSGYDNVPAVTLMFLSDAYVLSNKCRCEFSYAVNAGHWIIPVLLEENEMVKDGQIACSTGWSGQGSGDPAWWRHAQVLCEAEDGKHTVTAWHHLQAFSPPIDMREVESRGVSDEDLGTRVVERLVSHFCREEAFPREKLISTALIQQGSARIFGQNLDDHKMRVIRNVVQSPLHAESRPRSGADLFKMRRHMLLSKQFWSFKRSVRGDSFSKKLESDKDSGDRKERLRSILVKSIQDAS